MEGKNNSTENTPLSKSAPIQIQKQQNDSGKGLGMESAKRFIKGGASGLLSGALLQPLQVIKTSM